MVEKNPQDIVASVLQPLEAEVPAVLHASIERQGRNLLGLATDLLQSGMDEAGVRNVIAKVYASYRHELESVVLELRKTNEL